MMMGRFRGILAADDGTIVDRVEGRITCQSWDAMPWSGYVVVHASSSPRVSQRQTPPRIRDGQ
jgi:hypothetical protein